MSLVPYDIETEFTPFGFNNLGATCYFNAMLQSLLSCTSFTSELLKNEENKKYNENPVARKLIELIKAALSLKESISDNHQEHLIKLNISNLSPDIWKEMVMFLCKKNGVKIQQFMAGQQCAGEGFHCLLESLDNCNAIQNIFLHRYKFMIYCDDCNKCVSTVDSMNNLFEVQPDLKTEQLEKFKRYDKVCLEANSEYNNQEMNMFLAKQSGYVDKFYICPECKKDGEKYKISYLVMVPEVLVILSKKYTSERKLHINTEFPKTLEFAGLDSNTKLKYEAVSQIEHSGSLESGHYWAISRRNNGWYKLNDNSVTKSEFNPTENTYIVFYHLVG